MIIWLASYPRSGNTFFRVLLNSIFDTKTYSVYDDRFDIGADKELSDIVGHAFLPEGFSIARARKSDRVFVLKTHDYPTDIGSDDKIIYLLRDGRESVLSYSRFHRDYMDQPKSLLDIINGDTLFGGWGEHVTAWAPETRSNTLLVKFESLVADPLGQVGRIAEFTGFKPVSSQVPSFDELHSAGPKFFRSGKTDSWKQTFSEFEQYAFWLRNFAPMTDYGYMQDMPELFHRSASAAAYLSNKQLRERLPVELQGDIPAPADINLPEQSRAEILCRQGEELFHGGDIESAESKFLEAIQHSPAFADGYNNLGVLCWQRQEFEQAFEYLSAGLRIDPDHHDLVLNATQVLRLLGREQDACSLCESYLERNPQDITIQALLPVEGADPCEPSSVEPEATCGAESRQCTELNAAGEKAFLTGDFTLAGTYFEQAHKLNPDSVDVCNNLMVLYWQCSDIDKAIAYLLKAMEIDPVNRDVVMNGSQILAAIGQPAEAEALCQSYLKVSPDDDEIYGLFDALTSEKSTTEMDKNADFQAQISGNDAACDNSVEVLSDPRNIESDSTGNCHVRARNTTVQGYSIECIDFTRPENALQAPRISVVIPSFNQGAYLETTIRSVLDQGYPNLELIIMDGGSTDNSVSIIKKYQDKITWWQSQADDGQYWAVNEGFKKSSGEIMTWINSDDKLHPNSLNTVATIFSQKDNVEWVTGTPNVMNEAGVIKWICYPAPVFSQQNYLDKKYDVPSYIQQEGTFWHRSLWEKSGSTLQTALRMAGDLELWSRFFRYAPLYTLNLCTGCFREHKNQKTASAMALYRAEAEQILDAEIDLFRAGGGQVIKPVSPIRVKTAAQSVNVNRFVRKAVENELLFTASETEAHSTLPGSGKQGGSSETMHGQRKEVLVTAIVSTYNSEKYIRGCLEDLLAQTISDQLEIIVVDSGSQQNEGRIVREFQQRFSTIQYIRTEARETIYSAWNRAAQAARGKYLTNANTDDRHCIDAFERMVQVLEADEHTALVYADVAVTTHENSDLADAPLTGYFRWPEYDAKHLFSVCYIGPQPMWRRSLHEKYGYFEASLRVAGDYDFWLRMAPHEKFVHIPNVLGLYLSSKDSIEHAFSGIAVQESEQSRMKHWPVEWGERPALSQGYFAAIEGECITTTELANTEVDIPRSQLLVSVIIATKDREEMLGYALRSLEQQTYQNWEAIVINDGGVDVSGVIAHVDSKSRIRYLQNTESMGQAKARNRALKSVSGDIITFLDDDDIFLPDHLATVVDALNDDERQMFVYTDAYIVQETLKNGARREVNRTTVYEHGDYSKERLHIDNYIPINTWAFRRECIEKTGYFDESMNCCEDWEFLLRMAQEYKFRHIQSATVEVHHRVDIIDNVTRLRLDETVSAYEYIYSKYSDCDRDSIRQKRKNVIAGLREKAELQKEERTQGTLPPDCGDDGNFLLADDARQMELKRTRFIERISQPDYLRPAVHLVVLVSRDDMSLLGDTLASLGQQIYSGWGLSIISTEKMPNDEFARLSSLEWLHVKSMDAALNDVLTTSEADWLAVLKVGDKLSPYALSCFVDYINLHPDWKFVYTDESITDDSCDRSSLLFKPDINIDYLRSYPYIGDFCLFRRDVLTEINTAVCKQRLINLDVCLKVFDQWGETAIGHIASILNCRCANTERQFTNDELREVVAAHLLRARVNAGVVDGFLDGTLMIDYQLRMPSKVCLVIDARNNPGQILNTLNSVLTGTDYESFSIRVAVDDSGVSCLENLSDKRVHIGLVDNAITRADYTASVASECDADYLLFIEPGVMVLQSNWLEKMLAQVQRSEIAVAGVRLISQDKHVVHAGIVTGVGTFSVGACVFDGNSISDPGYMNRALVAQNMSAVSSACMLVDASLFLSIGGFDRKVDVPLYQDVDLCQRVLNENMKIVWTPFVSMLYIGNSLDGYTGTEGLSRVRKDSAYVSGKWLKTLARDVSYNRNLSMKRLDFEVDKMLSPEWDPELSELPRIMGFGVGSYGSWQYRVVQPLDMLQKSGVAQCANIPFSRQNQILLPTPVELERMQPDTLLMHNTLHDNFIEALEKYKKVNKAFIVFGQDDLMSALPPTNPFSRTIYKDVKKRIRKCLSLADRLLVTTEILAHELRGMADDIVVVPNCIDESVWGNLQSQRGVSSKPRVGWAGAQQHMGDLRLLEEVVRETASEVDWVFFGMCPDFLKPFVREVHDPVLFELYPEKLAEMNLDLAVAPLEHNKFNESKSNLRLLEYGILGWPVIASDCEPYRNCNAPVCRVTNQARAWINAIRERIDDLDAVHREGDVLRNWVRENCMLQGHTNVWLDALNPTCKADGLKNVNSLAVSI